MPRSPDRRPGPSLEEALILDNDTVVPTEDGEIRQVNGVIQGCEGGQLFYVNVVAQAMTSPNLGWLVDSQGRLLVNGYDT